MQLPRGTFHSIKKHVVFDAILSDAVESRFTGSILISFPGNRSYLVMHQGTTILAVHQDLCGNAALHQLQQSGAVPMDAEFTTLNETQIALAREFNKPCEIKMEAGSSIFFGKNAVSSVKGFIPVREKTGPVTASIPCTTSHPPRNLGDGEAEHLLSGDLEVLDQMDLHSISKKFRANAQHIARELNLDHLSND